MDRQQDPLRQLLDEHFEMDFVEFTRACGLARADLVELIHHGVIEVLGTGESASEADWRFTGRSLALARRAARLQSGFDLDTPALALALHLIARVEELERRIRELECQMPR